MSLDDATTQFLKQLAEAGGRPLHELSPEEARAMGVVLRELYGPGPEMAHVEDVTIESADGGSFPARVLTPAGDPRGVIVYYHGGGWVIGAIDEFDTLARKLADLTGCTVVLPGYRLAPEHRFPTAVEDAHAALRWTAAHHPGLPIVVAGDSAGGNLSAVVARRARDEGGPAIALQVLVYPVTDCDLDNASYLDPDNQLMLTRDTMIWFWDHYLPDPAARTHPDASPLRAADLSGLPPAVVLTAEHDVLRDEGEAYADKLREAGVPVTAVRYAGAIHDFVMLNALRGTHAAEAAITQAIGFLRKALA